MHVRPGLTMIGKRHHACGFTVVELMVAMTIGLVISLVVTRIYISGVATQQSQTDVTRMQESARFAFDALARALRKAGYKNPVAPGAGFCDPSPVIRLGGANDPSTIDPAAANFSGTSVTISNSSDAVRVRYYGEGLPYSPFTADNSILDCLGNAVPANTLAEDTFFIAADANNNNEPSLFCRSTNATASGNVALVPSVESLQFLFGEDSTGDGNVDRYVPAGSVSNFNNVRSVIVSVVVRSPNVTAATRSSRTFAHFGASYTGNGDSGSTFTAPADGRQRQMIGTTIALRNLCPT